MRFAVATLGCKVNHYDSAMIETRLQAAGLQRCEFGEAADVYVINTCTVTDRADTESLRIARRARRLNPAARVVMTGCLAQANPSRLDRPDSVDHVVGLARMDDLVAAAIGANVGSPRVMVSNLRKQSVAMEISAVAGAAQTRAFLKVQEGCDQYCSFCIVPTSRGRSRSVEPRRVLEAIDELYQQGFKEVTLSGVHLGGYGKDLEPAASLEQLLSMIAERCRIGRVRLSSIDPEELSDEIIDLVAQSPVFCPHFHLPLQAGDDEVLTAMRRRYDTRQFADRVERIVGRMPDAAVGTDLIAGFPGESRQQFERYFKFVERLPLAYFHVFPYSVRAGTTAAKLPGKVRTVEIRQRAEMIRELGKSKRRQFVGRFVGARAQVLFEDHGAAETELKGYSRNYIRFELHGPDHLRNHEVEVEAVAVSGESMVGRLVGECVQH